jgi:uncharacterized membrane protein
MSKNVTKILFHSMATPIIVGVLAMVFLDENLVWNKSVGAELIIL